MGIHEPFDARVEHSNLRLDSLPHIGQTRHLAHQFARPKYWRQQIFKRRIWRHVFAACRIQRINDGKRFRRPSFDIINAVANEFLVRTKSPDLLDARV